MKHYVEPTIRFSRLRHESRLLAASGNQPVNNIESTSAQLGKESDVADDVWEQGPNLWDEE